jgi:MSHA biogenesis protein MshJ
MMKYLKPILVQFKALNTRERLLTIAAFLGVIYFIFDFALIRPQTTQAKELRQKITQQEAELAAAAQTLQALSAVSAADPLARQRAQRDAMRATFADAEALMGRVAVDVRMGDVVRAMVAAKPGLTLVSLRTLPAELFYQPPAPPAPAAGASAPTSAAAPGAPAAATAASVTVPTLYKHGIEVTVQGSYPALVAYMQQLERNGGSMFWGNVTLDVVGHPEARLKMSVYTLSPRPEQPLG